VWDPTDAFFVIAASATLHSRIRSAAAAAAGDALPRRRNRVPLRRCLRSGRRTVRRAPKSTKTVLRSSRSCSAAGRRCVL
jgi:hypothetical protein